MTLTLRNSLTRRLEPFEPADPSGVTLYACGPTVYNHVHIGNWSAFIFYDVLVRYLRASGHGVRFVCNITDVDDKIIRDCQAAGIDRATFTQGWTNCYFEDLGHLACLEADDYPKATEYIEPMIAMVQTLLDRGVAYVADDDDGSSSIYYRVSSFEHYGELANLSRDAVRDGASGRVQADEYEKEDVGDFALWKGWTPRDGDVVWPATFQVDGEARDIRGRPGWHIECSVMVATLLGDQIDLHLGGEDLRFPHHQNEIAQSEAATGKRPFVRTWMHRRHLLVDGKKMSKSLGNFFTLRDLIEAKGPHAARGFRYFVVSAHYGSPIDFSWTGLEAAMKTLRNLDDDARRIRQAAGDAEPSDFADDAGAAFRAAMDNDLQTSEALAAIHGMLRECNRRTEAGSLTPADAASACRVLDLAERVLGLALETGPIVLTDEQQALLDERADARARKDFAESDRLRDALHALGILVKDTKDGQEVRPV